MRVLMTNVWLDSYGGSELVTVEVAEELQSQGHEVVIYSPRVSGMYPTVTVTDKKPDPAGFDLLWIHHNLLIHDLGFRKRDSQRIIFNHMSSYVPTEWPRLASYENAIADVILANSEETRLVLEGKGLRGVRLFQNPAPRAFEGVGYSRFAKPLLISNHPPVELSGVRGTRVGADRPMRVTPDMMAEASCVVCNGKSVVYALRAGVPVYLYDHFGGCGWLTDANMELAEKHNFSGRPWGRKTVDDIMAEMSAIPAPMPCADRFRLEKVLEGIV